MGDAMISCLIVQHLGCWLKFRCCLGVDMAISTLKPSSSASLASDTMVKMGLGLGLGH